MNGSGEIEYQEEYFKDLVELYQPIKLTLAKLD